MRPRSTLTVAAALVCALCTPVFADDTVTPDLIRQNLFSACVTGDKDAWVVGELGRALHTQDGGKILLSAEGDEAEVRIAVADDGPGIPEDRQAEVFRRFHRVGGQALGEAALGLGLPLTRQFVEAHGGHVELVSEAGKGTMVRLHIPRTPK